MAKHTRKDAYSYSLIKEIQNKSSGITFHTYHADKSLKGWHIKYLWGCGTLTTLIYSGQNGTLNSLTNLVDTSGRCV